MVNVIQLNGMLLGFRNIFFINYFWKTHPSLSNAVKQASIAEPFESSMTIGGVGESITATMLPTSKQSQQIQQRTLT